VKNALNFEVISGEYVIFKMKASALVPAFVFEGDFFSILKSSTELSVVCAVDRLPPDFKCDAIDKGWSLMRLLGPFDFDQTGILKNVLVPLAAEKIGILAVSSFDTDYVLVKTKNFERAKEALRNQGYVFVD
jgi:uncharacterized protein